MQHLYHLQAFIYICYLFQSSADPARDSDNDSSVSGLSNLSGLSGEESWKPVSGKYTQVLAPLLFLLRNEFHFSDVHGAMNHSGSHAK